MKRRFILLNTTILLIFAFLVIAFVNYSKLKNTAIGEVAKNLIEEKEKVSFNKIATLKLSVYNTQTNELNQLRNDIMAKFQENDFESITILPKAAFIDSLLHDSKLKKYMNSNKLNKSNQSLLNKMKLYLPNELLISFLPKRETINQIYSIEEYLEESGYIFISGSSIPTVKSSVKHYYYDKNLFQELDAEISNLTQQRYFLSINESENRIIELILLIFLIITITLLIQLLDYYLLNANMEKIKFLLKGHINPKKYYKLVIVLKSLSLSLILIISLLALFLSLTSKTYFEIENSLLIFVAVTAFINLGLFILKKERINL